MRVVASQTGDFSRAQGQSVMQNVAQSLGKGFTAVYAHNDEMALGAIEALKAAGRAPGKDVTVVSVDGERAALESIQRGELGATVESNPRFGPLAFETVEQVRKGQPVPPKKLVPDRFFDRTNAAQFVAERTSVTAPDAARPRRRARAGARRSSAWRASPSASPGRPRSTRGLALGAGEVHALVARTAPARARWSRS
jgi:hypothetical protein